MKNRIHFIQKNFLKKNEALFVNKDVDITYLSGFSASESWLLVTQQKAYYITDFRYILEAQKGLPEHIELRQYTKSFLTEINHLLQVNKIKNLKLDTRHVSHAQYQIMQKIFRSAIRLVENNSLVEDLREIKEKEEIAKIRQALKIHQGALKFLKKEIKPGKTERQILWKLENYVKAHKVGFSFSPIVASGPNSAFPHAKVTDRVIKNNEPVLIDIGIDYKGYKSDLTRMFYLGKIAKLVSQVDQFCREAQRQAIAKIRDGVKASDVDYEARNYLKTKTLDQYFGHSLGHGVGLEIHESPRLSQTNSSVLKAGMVITVEPGVYIPYKFGVRIEDMVLVTKNGNEVLSGNID